MAKKQQKEDKAFKHWFDRSAARRLGAQVAAVLPDFDDRKFVKLAVRDLATLEMMARVRQFSEALKKTLPESTPRALAVLTRSLPPILPDAEAVTDGWLQWPVGQFIADHGLDHFDASMEAMVALTQRFSSEFAVRPFVIHRPVETFSRLLALTDHASEHVRRWCSEGARPRLPWGAKAQHLVEDPTPVWPIVEALRDDGSRYVQRSVANNLNDIAKDHPAQVVKRCRAWSKDASEERTWLINHALRTLVKDGDPKALSVIGFKPPKKLTARLTITPKKIAVGGVVELTAELRNEGARPQPLLIDYVVHYVRQRGRSSGKVFKWTKVRLPARGEITIHKRHAMKITTIRALYPGVHRVELQVNGVRLAEASFQLQ